jgi:hypothetical protein
MSDRQAAAHLLLDVVLEAVPGELQAVDAKEMARRLGQERVSEGRANRIKSLAAQQALLVAQRLADRAGADYSPGQLGRLVGAGI